MLVKFYTGIVIAALIAVAATITFQVMEMNAYSLFETLTK